jgi:predicted metal-dependent peptidase
MLTKLSEFFVYMLVRKGFYGRLASSMTRVATNRIPTLAVGMRDGRITLFYNPTFLDGLSYKAAAFILEHEMMHVILDHIPRFLELLAVCPTDQDRVKAAAVYNIAMDAPINDLLRGHEGFQEADDYTKQYVLTEVRKRTGDETSQPHEKDGMVLPERFELPVSGSFEDYLWVLMQRVHIVEIAIQLVGGSNHQMWIQGGAGEGDQPGNKQGESDGEQDGDGQQPGGKGKGKDGKKGPVDYIFGDAAEGVSAGDLLSQAHNARQHLKNTLRSVVRSNGGLGRGLLPGNLEEWLEAYLADPVMPWWEIFSTRAKMSRASKQRRSVALPNRMLLGLAEEDDRVIPTPGKTRDKSWRVFAMVDTSGSMDTESLRIFQSELHAMLSVDENMEVRYMQGDAAVHFDLVLKTGDPIPGNMIGRGGTDFTAYFEYMKQYCDDPETTPDIVVVYTDGFAPPIAPESRLSIEIPVIWLVTPQHATQMADGYGEIIVCDPEHNERYRDEDEAA